MDAIDSLAATILVSNDRQGAADVRAKTSSRWAQGSGRAMRSRRREVYLALYRWLAQDHRPLLPICSSRPRLCR